MQSQAKRKHFLLQKLPVLLAALHLAALPGGARAQGPAFYNQADAGAAPTALEERAFASISAYLQKRGLTAPHHSPGMARGARGYLAYLKTLSRAELVGFRIDRRQVRALLHEAGATGFAQLVPVGIGDMLDLALSQAYASMDEEFIKLAVEQRISGMGVAAERGEQGLVYVVAFLTTLGVRLDPFPKSVDSDRPRVLSGSVLPPFTNPSVAVTDPRGDVSLPEVSRRGDRFETRVAFSKGKGEYRIEVVVEDDRGPRVIALFPVRFGDAQRVLRKPSSREKPRLGSARDVEVALIGRINEVRVSQNLPPLEEHPRLREVARAFSEEMMRSKRLSHVSPKSGTASDRLTAAKIPFVRVLENLAWGEAVEDVHEDLLASPIHRSNMLDEGVQWIGVGCVLGEVSGAEWVFVTEYFVESP